MDETALWHLRSFLLGSTTLLYLNVSHCDIHQHNFAVLADGLHKSKSVVRFNGSRLVGNTLTMDSQKIVHLLSTLLWQRKLQELSMQCCELVGQDMQIFSEYLFDCQNPLRKLNLSYNKIGSDGLEFLLQAISSSKQLKHLELNGCSLGTHGGEMIAKFLSSCRFLNFLALKNNGMSAEAVSMILLTMKKPVPLTKLLLWQNKYDCRTGEILRRLLDSGVLPQKNIDITVTFDDILNCQRVIPWITSGKEYDYFWN